MIDKPAPSGQLVTVHTRQRDGKLSAPLGTAEVVDSNVVILHGVTTLRLPIVVVAQPAAVVASARGPKPAPVTIDVVAVHTPEKPVPAAKDSAPLLALELATSTLDCPKSPLRAAASWWCMVFPWLPGCSTK